MTQSTQGILGEREEQLGVSDRGVIKFRKVVLDAIESAIRGDSPRGASAKHRGDGVIRLDSFAGVRAKVAVS
jgi:hypothetical protein